MPVGRRPAGWLGLEDGESASYTFLLHENVIGFATAESTLAEGSANVQAMLEVAPIAALGEGETASLAVRAAQAQGSKGLTGGDYSFSPSTLTFTSANGTTPQTIMVTVNSDDEAENEESTFRKMNTCNQSQESVLGGSHELW